MEYVYAALMLHKLEKEVNEANVTSVVKATGAEVNEAQVKALVASLTDVNIDDAIKAAPVAVAAAAPAAAAGGDAPKEGKKAEPPSEKQEEAAMEGLSSLFG
jgi:large subunit ribosomal protein L12